MSTEERKHFRPTRIFKNWRVRQSNYRPLEYNWWSRCTQVQRIDGNLVKGEEKETEPPPPTLLKLSQETEDPLSNLQFLTTLTRRTYETNRGGQRSEMKAAALIAQQEVDGTWSDPAGRGKLSRGRGGARKRSGVTSRPPQRSKLNWNKCNITAKLRESHFRKRVFAGNHRCTNQIATSPNERIIKRKKERKEKEKDEGRTRTKNSPEKKKKRRDTENLFFCKDLASYEFKPVRWQHDCNILSTIIILQLLESTCDLNQCMYWPCLLTWRTLGIFDKRVPPTILCNYWHAMLSFTS